MSANTSLSSSSRTGSEFFGFSVPLSELSTRLKENPDTAPAMLCAVCDALSNAYGDRRITLISGNGKTRVQVAGGRS